MTDLKPCSLFSASTLHAPYKLEISRSNSHGLVRSLVHFFKGALIAFASHAVVRWGTWIPCTFSHKWKAHVSTCLPHYALVPTFCRHPLGNPLQEREKLSGALTSWPYISLLLLSLVLTMTVSSTGCHKLSCNQQECFCGSCRDHVGRSGVRSCNCSKSKPFACPHAISQNGAFVLTTARFWPITQRQANSSLSEPLRDWAPVCSKTRGDLILLPAKQGASEKFKTSMPIYGSFKGASFQLRVWFARNCALSHSLSIVAAAWELKMCPTFRKEMRCSIIKPIHTNDQHSTEPWLQMLKWAISNCAGCLSSCQKISCLDREMLCRIKYVSFFMLPASSTLKNLWQGERSLQASLLSGTWQ